MHRASQGIRILPAAIFAVAASLALALPVCAQSDEEQRRYEEWKQQQEAKGTRTIAPSAAGQEWVTVSSDSPGVEKQIVDQLISQINNVLNKGVPYAPQGQLTEIFQKARGRAESIKGTYQGFKTQKALAACINWDASRLDRIAFFFGGSKKNTILSAAIDSAIFQCDRFKEKKNTANCECKVIAKNDRFEFEVPKSFLSRLSTSPRPNATALNEVDFVPYINERGKQGYKEFLARPLPQAFAISATGAWGWGSKPSFDEAKRLALANCQEHSSVACFLYAVNDEVVWKGE